MGKRPAHPTGVPVNGGRTPAEPSGPASGAAHGTWLTRGKDGKLTLYALAPDGVVRWMETTVGGPDWSGPHVVPVPGLTRLTVLQGANSYVHFLGRRERTGADGARSVDIVHAVQYQTGLAFSDWRSLGSPSGEAAALPSEPAGAVARDGSVHVVVRGDRGGLKLRRETPNGKWRAWEQLPGGDVHSPPAAVALSDGRIEVCARAETGVLVWRQSEPGGDFTVPRAFSLRPVPGTATALETGPGRPTFFWSDSETDGAVAWRVGDWPIALGGTAADGPYAALRTSLDGFDCAVLAHRGRGGAAVLGMGGVEKEADGFWWYELPETCQGAPALALDGRGRVVMALIGPDGRPRVARQGDGDGLALTRWHTLEG
ncbi:hypothetical protein OG968_07585 [Streptomyces althioticus]|uniref:hypothetical protein n=1 Tax=Streptomyces althioticus TaxID=83380 RepID=UPI003872AF59|nr:hypothetical protein OG968_07585 [Streptomyces althioticus]